MNQVEKMISEKGCSNQMEQVLGPIANLMRTSIKKTGIRSEDEEDRWGGIYWWVQDIQEVSPDLMHGADRK